MRNFFQHIRRQPKSVRDNYALGIAGSFTTIVVLLWVVAFPSEGLLDAPEPEVEKLTPFATLISESKERIASFKNTLNSASSSDSQAAVVTASTSTAPESIVLSDTDIALAVEKASSTGSGTSSPMRVEYEVLIGTTTQSGVGSSTATATETSASATGE